jgi:septal ring-binding cell division protein DamX
VSTMETPPPETPVQAGPPERRCPRCGSNLAAEQEWCLNCGAAAGTEVVEARGWRVPLYLGGGLAALAVIGVILAIVALASRNDVVAGNPTPTPSASAVPPGATSTVPPLATTTPLPSTTPDPNATPTVSPDPNATPTVSPDPNATPEPTETATPEPTATEDPNTDTGSGSTFPDWSGADGDYTIIIESAKSRSGAEKIAQKAQDAGLSDVGILKSGDYSSLNAGYQVVFTGVYTSKKDAQDALSGARSDFKDAYVRQIRT